MAHPPKLSIREWGKAVRAMHARPVCAGDPLVHPGTHPGTIACVCHCDDCATLIGSPDNAIALCICRLCSCGETSRGPRWRN